MTRALVTGANGHIGANVVRVLIERGVAVRGLVREGSDRRGLEGLDVELATGDLLDAASLRAAAEGCDQLYHLGAVYSMESKDPDAIVRPAVMGTENAFHAAKEAGIARIVATSSSNAVGFAKEGDAARDESHWNESTNLPYIVAKNLAERRTWELAEELDLEVMTALPTGVVGRFDYKKTPTSGPVLEMLAAQEPVIFAANVVDVRDVALGHVLAMEKGTPGERYLLGAMENPTRERFADIAESMTGKRPKTQAWPPRSILMVVASLMEFGSWIGGGEPKLSRAGVRDAHGRAGTFDCSKARDELGLEAHTLEEALTELVRWGRHMGWYDGPIVDGRDDLEPDPSWVS